MLLSLHNVIKTYTQRDKKFNALDGFTLTINEDEYVSIMGPSGSGKSTLLHVMSLLDNPTSGVIALKDHTVQSYSETQLAKLLNLEIGFVFQQVNLLAKVSALENVVYPLVYSGIEKSERAPRAKKMLEQV